MIEDYVPTVKRHYDFNEKFIENRIQTKNNSERPGLKDSRPLPSMLQALSAVSRKRISNTSFDSGVNYPQVTPPAMPVTPIARILLSPIPYPQHHGETIIQIHQGNI